MFSTPSPWSESASQINNDFPELGAYDVLIPDTASERVPSASNKNIRERPSTIFLGEVYPPEYYIDGRRNCTSGFYCNEEFPCNDSLSDSLEFDDAQLEVLDSLGPPINPPQSITTNRARLACQACRRDNKKCDDNRPCARCLAREESCIHVEKAARTTKRRCQTCRLSHLKCEDTRPCHQCVKAGTTCVDVSKTGGNHRTKVKKACAQCRRSKIQCDEERPCRNCSRRNLVCGRLYNAEENSGKYSEGVNDKAHGYSTERRNGDDGAYTPVESTQMPLRIHEVATDYNKTDINNYHVYSTERTVGDPSVFPATQNLAPNLNTFPCSYPTSFDSIQQVGYTGISDGVHSYNSNECRQGESSLHLDGPGPVLMPVMPVPDRILHTTYSTLLPASYSNQSQERRPPMNYRRDLTMSGNSF